MTDHVLVNRSPVKIPDFVRIALNALALRYMEQEPSQILSEYGEDYLHRWFLEKDQFKGSVYIHRILRSDYDDELHDHPGDNMSIILDGQITEIMPSGKRILNPGDVILRKATDRHKIEIESPVTTIWIMGERVREWGFWDDSGQFIPSQEFFKMRSRPY